MNDAELSYRGFIWNRTLPMLRETTVIGKGPGAFAAEFPNDETAKLFKGEVYVDRPHNLYLGMAHASGNLAASFYIVAVVTFGVLAWRRRQRDGRLLAVLAAVVGYSVAALVDDPGVGVAPVFWVLWGAGFALLGAKA